jgi:replicative DNA helicase
MVREIVSSELESKTLSAVLADKQIHVLLQANPDNLFKSHGDIWEFIRNYSEQNLTVPPVSIVVEKFRDFSPYKDIGSTKHHLEELRAEYLSNNLEGMIRKAATKLGENQPVEALNSIIADSSELKKITADVRDLDVVDIEDAIAYYKNVKEMSRKGSFGIKTNLKGFDDFLPSGISDGHFGILLAYPSIGKSWLSVYMAVEAWKAGKKPLLISLEMTESEVRNRVYTIMGNGKFSHKKFSGGEINLDEFRSWADVHFKNMPPFYIVSSDGLGEVSPAVVRGKTDQYSPDIVFVDYIQLMQPNTKTDNEVVRIKNISRELKILAISEQVPVVAIASATPDDVTDMSSPPSLGQVAWSKQLAYDADWVLSLGRSAGSTILECVFRKNRHGFLGEFLIDVDFDSGRFVYKDINL